MHSAQISLDRDIKGDSPAHNEEYDLDSETDS